MSAQNGPVHAGATLAAKPRADTVQHTALPTMHRPFSVTHRHAHSPPLPEGARPDPRAPWRRPSSPALTWKLHRPRSRPGARSGLGPGRGRPQRATLGRVQPAWNKGCVQAAGAACIPAPRRGGGGGAGARAAPAPARSALPAPRALRLPRSRSLLPATAAAVRLPHRTHQLFIARLQLPGRSQSQSEALLMGPPPPRRQPAARPGASDSPPGTGMGRGRAGAGAHRARRRNFPRPRALRGAPAPRRRDHPPCLRPRGAGGSGEAGRAAAGGGEGGGGAREEDERLADLPRRLQGALARARPPRPASLAVRTPAPQPAARTHSRAQTVSPATLLRGSASEYESEAAHISNLHAGVVLVHAAAERTHDPTSGAPASGRGRRQAPFPPPPRQLIGSNTCTSGSPGTLPPKGAAGKAQAVGDFGCLLPPQENPPKWSC